MGTLSRLCHGYADSTPLTDTPPAPEGAGGRHSPDTAPPSW